LDKLGRLKAIDRQCQAFGADTHRYLLRPCLAATAIEGVERRMGVALPPALRRFYTEAGDGIAGPYYGLRPAAKLTGYRPSASYPGVAVFRQVAAAEGMPSDEGGYFEMTHEALAGLLSIIDEGCGHEVCLIATGPQTGNVVHVSADGYVVETEATLIDLYTEWLDREIERFETVRALMSAGKTFAQIRDEMVVRFQEYNAGDRIVSVADVPKPAVLFGEGNHRIYHGATQDPWYENILKDWQQRKQ
jgi:hypothetical protein